MNYFRNHIKSAAEFFKTRTGMAKCIIINLLLLVVVLVYLLGAGITQHITEKKTPPVSKMIAAGSLRAVSDGYIYFIENKELYKINVDTGEKTALSISNPYFVYVQDGWIYYLIKMEKPKINIYNFYKKNTDGTGEAIICEISLLLTPQAANGWLYYISYPGRTLYRIRLDGTEAMQITDAYITRFNIVGNWIYYINSGSLYKMKTNGANNTKINNEEVKSFSIYSISVEKRWIVFHAGDIWGSMDLRPESYTIYRMRTNGRRLETVGEEKAYELVMKDGWIYYTNYADNRKLYRIRPDGRGKTKLSEDAVFDIFFMGKTMYYSGSTNIYEMSIDN